MGRCCNLRDRRGQMSSSRAAVSHPTTNKWQPHLFAGAAQQHMCSKCGNARSSDCRRGEIGREARANITGQDLIMKLVHARWEFLLSVNASVRQHVSAPSPSCRVFSIHSHDTVTQPRWITGGWGWGAVIFKGLPGPK